VNFSGQLDRADAMRVLESSTIHAHASHEESFGLSVLESMALGVPVVAAKGSGGPEWLLSNDAGLIVDAGDPHEFADGIVSLLLDRVRRDSIREAASLRFAEEFQPAAVASRYEAFYKSVIAAKTARDRRDA
jgi:glycosyltransferase involved in cell wall biosynthesis